MSPEKITKSAKATEVNRNWFIVDADGQTLGRLASQVASILRGKHKPTFTLHVDTGDHVIVINAEKIQIASTRAEQKEYVRHTGYPGGQRIVKYNTMLEKFPERIIEKAVRKMLPKNRLGNEIVKKLKVYAGTKHPHTAQKPEALTLKYS
ncbi:MAG: 50S ribosomal protein L13 [Chlorobiota bacterium]|jgi:large subunit ribosomal protein L13|nr:50S ribosomal protein L13 [Chlorobiota bacterium]QQS65875.1 MAG: 50S ribosomal protein L13 [Chlorobiota bacterium]